MPIKVAKTSGFCYGVRRAMELALKASHKHRFRQVFTWGPLVHNRQAVDLLQARNIIPAEDMEVIQGGVVLIRAHGVGLAIRNELEKHAGAVIDATCPHVAYAQKIAGEYASQGYAIIIIGDRGHPEVAGILGYVPEGRGFVVESPEEVSRLPKDLGKVCVVAQTTQSGERFEPIVERIKKFYPEAKIFNTVCGATSQRQKEIKELAKEVDAMVVIGGYHSANTRRLAEISRQYGVPTFHIETAEELEFNKVSQYRTIGVTAGASTPHWVIRNVIERLREFEEMQRSPILRFIHRLLRFIIYSQIYLAVGAGCVTFAVQCLLGLPQNFMLSVLSALYVLCIHTLNRFLSLPKDESLLYGMHKYFAHQKHLMHVLWIISGILAVLVSAFLGLASLILVSVSLVLGALYSLAIIPQEWLPGLKYRRLMDIPGSKDLFMAIAWAVVGVVIPFVANRASAPIPAFLMSILFVLILVLVRSMIYNIREIEGDIIIGRETIPIVIGRRWTERIISVLLIALTALLIAGWVTKIFPVLSLLLLITVGYIILTAYNKWHTEFYQGLAYDAMIDGQFILVGLIAIIWRFIID